MTRSALASRFGSLALTSLPAAALPDAFASPDFDEAAEVSLFDESDEDEPPPHAETERARTPANATATLRLVMSAPIVQGHTSSVACFTAGSVYSGSAKFFTVTI